MTSLTQARSCPASSDSEFCSMPTPARTPRVISVRGELQVEVPSAQFSTSGAAPETARPWRTSQRVWRTRARVQGFAYTARTLLLGRCQRLPLAVPGRHSMMGRDSSLPRPRPGPDRLCHSLLGPRRPAPPSLCRLRRVGASSEPRSPSLTRSPYSGSESRRVTY